jgi:glyoxylase I family protein
MAVLASLSHLYLTVTDIERSATFYRPVMSFLGFRLAERRSDMMGWDAPPGGAPQRFTLVPARADRAYLGHDRYSPGLHHIAWNAESRSQVDDLHRVLAEQGMNVLDPPAEYGYAPGYYAVFFADPDGIKLELVHIP